MLISEIQQLGVKQEELIEIIENEDAQMAHLTKKLTNHLNTKQENVNSQITGPLQPKNFFTKKYEPLNEDSEVEEDVDEEEDSSSETPTIFSVSSKRRNITKLLSLLALHME